MKPLLPDLSLYQPDLKLDKETGAPVITIAPGMKTMNDVQRLISLRKSETIIEQCFELVQRQNIYEYLIECRDTFTANEAIEKQREVIGAANAELEQDEDSTPLPAWLAYPIAPVLGTWSDYKSRNYAEFRQSEYKSYGEQLDMMFHDMAAWKAHIAQVKAKFPKPTGV